MGTDNAIDGYPVEMPDPKADKGKSKDDQSEKPQENSITLGAVPDANYKRGIQDLGTFFSISDPVTRNQHRGLKWKHLTVQPSIY